MFWGTLFGAGHFSVLNNGGEGRGPATAWLRYHLMNDQDAGALFYGSSCELCSDIMWIARRKGIQ